MADQLEPGDELLWRQYNAYVGLFKFFISSSIKLNTFYYAITGAIVSFYLTNTQARPLRFALVLPLVFSVALCVVFFWGIMRARDLTEAIGALNDKLAKRSTIAGFRPATETLRGLLVVFFLLQVVNALGLLLLICDLAPIAGTSKGP